MVVAITHRLGTRTKSLCIRTASTNDHAPPVHKNEKAVDQDSLYKW